MKNYPHSSKRQQARYARQLATGKLNLAIVEPTTPPAPAAEDVQRVMIPYNRHDVTETKRTRKSRVAAVAEVSA